MAPTRKRILYGFQGDGRGHLSRAETIIPELAKYHNLLVLCNLSGGKKLPDRFYRFPGVTIIDDVYSPSLIFKNDHILLPQTTLTALYLLVLKGLPSAIRAIHNYLKFQPEFIISDLEPATAWLAFFSGRDYASLDHQHILTDCSLDLTDNSRRDLLCARLMIKFLNPAGKNSTHIITSFFPIESRNSHTYVYGPLLRQEIIQARPRVTEKDFVLVYQSTPSTFDIIDKVLKKITDTTFVIYNMGKSHRDQNLVYKPNSTKSFIRDLCSCKAVICNGGNMLISEALFLGKKVLSVPIDNSYEQIVNSVNLQNFGNGHYSRQFNEHAIRSFIGGLDNPDSGKYAGHCDNERIINHILSLIDRVGS